jgi:hypothetical protein
MTAAELGSALAGIIEDEWRATRPEARAYKRVGSIGELIFRAETSPLLEELLSTAALALLDARGTTTYNHLANRLYDHELEEAFALVTRTAARRSPERQKADLERVRLEIHDHLTRLAH